jgi:Fe-S cluster biogenesis protein NfuA
VKSQRVDLAGLAGDVERLETIFETWEETPRGTIEPCRRTIEALHGEALRRLVRTLKTDPAALAAIKDAVTDELVYAVLRRHEILKASLSEQVEAALASVPPMLASHGGDVELLKVAPPAIEVRFTGASDGCPASVLTFRAGAKKGSRGGLPPDHRDPPDQGIWRRWPRPHAFRQSVRLGRRGRFDLRRHADANPRRKRAGDRNRLREGAAGSPRVGRHLFPECPRTFWLYYDDGIDDGIVACPHHGFRHDLASGECPTAPEVTLQSHAVRVVGHRVEVRLAK